jgi:hypothetical protein
MKKAIFLFLTFISTSLFAQDAVINNFESEFFGKWGTNGNPTSDVTNEDHVNFSIVSNPSATGINTSSNVAKFHRLKSGQWWALAWFEFSPLQITATVNSPKYLHISIYKPVASTICVQMKDQASSPTFNTGELMSDKQTKINEWQDIVFKITTSGTFSDIEIKPDFISTSNPSDRFTDDIDIYIDNIVVNNDPTPLGEKPEPKPEYKGNLPEGFEGANSLIDLLYYPDRYGTFGQTANVNDLTVVDNPSKTGINTTDKCAKFVRKANGNWWAGIYMNPLNSIVVDESNKYFHIMVYRVSDPTPLSLKLENSTGNTGDIVLQGNVNGTYDWIDYVFQVPSEKYGSYDKFDLMPDFVQTPAPSERYFDDALIYFDAIELNSSPTPRTTAVINGIFTPSLNKINAWSDKSGNLNFRLPETNDEIYKIELYDSLGKLLNNKIINNNCGVVTVSTSQSKGLVLLKVSTSTKDYIAKVNL